MDRTLGPQSSFLSHPPRRFPTQGQISADQPGMRVMGRAICSPGSAHSGADWPQLLSGQSASRKPLAVVVVVVVFQRTNSFLVKYQRLLTFFFKLFFSPLGGATCITPVCSQAPLNPLKSSVLELRTQSLQHGCAQSEQGAAQLPSE